MVPEWHILGAGAIGCLWGACLSRSGSHVELLLKDTGRLETFNQRPGIFLDGAGLLPATARVAGTAGPPVSRLLIATKAHQTEAALRPVLDQLTPDCRVLLVQNGMGIAGRLALPGQGQKLYCAVTTDGAYCPEPFSVVHAGQGDTYIGSYGGDGNAERLVDELPGTYLRVFPVNDIERRQWQKLAVNCAINGLTVIHNCRNGELLENAPARARLGLLCAELACLGEFIGFPEWPHRLLEDTENVVRRTAKNYSSMYQDIHNRRKTEIDYLNGFFIEQASHFGVPSGENQLLYREIKELETRLDCR